MCSCGMHACVRAVLAVRVPSPFPHPYPSLHRSASAALPLPALAPSRPDALRRRASPSPQQVGVTCHIWKATNDDAAERHSDGEMVTRPLKQDSRPVAFMDRAVPSFYGSGGAFPPGQVNCAAPCTRSSDLTHAPCPMPHAHAHTRGRHARACACRAHAPPPAFRQ